VAEPPSRKLYEMLPNDIGGFHQLPSMRPLVDLAKEAMLDPSFFRSEANQERIPFIGAETEYLSSDGDRLTVEILKFHQDSDAYSFLTLVARKMRETGATEPIASGGIGTASVISPNQIAFFKGTTFVRVTNTDTKPQSSASVAALSRLFADRLDKGEGDIPVLLKHLPDWQTAQATAVYAVSPQALRNEVKNQPVLDAVSFEGGAEAVAANYGPAQLVIVEFNTPQLASDNDRRITAKIQELRSQGQAVPTAYRRVGNYSVFVFNAPDEQAANQLIDEVKYQQVVQWLGNDPNILAKAKAAEREFVDTTLGVFVSVVKASGLAIVLCFGVGGLFGALLFSRRRAQQTSTQAYSDAGGMLRLNIDEMTASSDPGRLLGPGNR
jgi:hypothetical protein